jgi:hypothetical protein
MERLRLNFKLFVVHNYFCPDWMVKGDTPMGEAEK